MSDRLIFEESRAGRCGGIMWPAGSPGGRPNDVPVKPIERLIPSQYLRQSEAELPEVNEVTIVRHYTNLSKKNTGVDDSFYPLGSCTMKYNPKINETLSALEGFSGLHPYQPEETVQGILQIMYETGEYLKEISGMSGVTLQPAAGAQGELTGLKIIRAYHKDRGTPIFRCSEAPEWRRTARKYVLIPDSAHGTNPASVVFSGYQPIEIKSDVAGNVDIADLKAKLNPEVAALMLTIPNTLGLFDPNLKTLAGMLHEVGAFLYMDGANLNALMGIIKPAEAGVDVLHFNLHKTFSTPHGGGGPGSGPVAVTAKLAPYLPVPLIKHLPKTYPSRDGGYHTLDYNRPKTIGRIKGFYGNIGVVVKAYIYIRLLGAAGLKRVSEIAVLNANYLKERLKKYYHLPYDRPCMHECVLSGVWSVPTVMPEAHPPVGWTDPPKCGQVKKSGVHTLDIAKRLLDYGFHPPTIYFPLIVPEAIMIEPTETEGKETLDDFINAMIKIAEESEKNPEIVKSAPHGSHHPVRDSRPVKRLDEVKAARELVLRWQK